MTFEKYKCPKGRQDHIEIMDEDLQINGQFIKFIKSGTRVICTTNLHLSEQKFYAHQLRELFPKTDFTQYNHITKLTS